MRSAEDDLYAARMREAMERVMNERPGVHRIGGPCRWVDGRLHKYGGLMLPGFKHEDDQDGRQDDRPARD